MKKINLYNIYHIKNFSDIDNDNLKKKYPKKFINLNHIHYNLNNLNNDLNSNVYYLKNKALSNKNKNISNIFFPFNHLKKDENILNKNNNINKNINNSNDINDINDNNNKLLFNKNIKTAYDYYKKSKANSNVKNKFIYNMLIPCVKIISSPTNKKTSNFNTLYKTNSLYNNYKTQRIPKKISFSFSKNNYYINKSYNSNNNLDNHNKILVLNKEELNNHFIFHNKFIKDAIKNIKLKHKNVSSSVNNINNFNNNFKLNNINNNNYLTLDINSNYNYNNLNNNINNFYKNLKTNKETHFNLKKSSSCGNFNLTNVKFNKNNFLIHKKYNKINNNNDNKSYLLKNFYKIFK